GARPTMPAATTAIVGGIGISPGNIRKFPEETRAPTYSDHHQARYTTCRVWTEADMNCLLPVSRTPRALSAMSARLRARINFAKRTYNLFSFQQNKPETKPSN